ncbi:MAG: M18 family aminopeptidase [Coriobacteriia bacterium]|nr:M18 family aminopeptidase [Coriobacteriia bacterium]
MNIIPNKAELNFTKRILELMDVSPTSFNVIDNNKKLLEEAGYQELIETKKWSIKPGGKYYVTRNMSCIAAFQIPNAKNLDELKKKLNGFMIVATHSDHPCFKLKRNPEIETEEYTVLNTEPYGNLMYYTWMDRPLTVAGRVFLKTKKGFKTKSVMVNRPLFLIPSLSAHQSDDVNNKGFVANAHTHMRPLFAGLKNNSLLDIVASENNVSIDDIIDYELYACRTSESKIWGANYEFMSARAIDDQTSVYCSLLGLLEAKPTYSIPLHVVFDNEEIGSSTKQGANSTILPHVLQRITESLGLSFDQYVQALPSSLIVSADNGHAYHPNYGEATDKQIKTYLGQGILLKYTAGFAYATDGVSSTLTYKLAEKGSVPIQEYYNKSGITPGSTLARFISPKTTIPSADIGLPQLAMHSSYETCSTKDLIYLKDFAKTVYSSSIKMEKDGNYIVI